MIRTRFAPSPTGKLHIGGARTALFNYLFSKYNKGEFLLRIENTDKQRSSLENINVILNGLEWLHLTPSKKVTYQSEQVSKHLDVAYQLIKKGFAYKCYLTFEELESDPAEKELVVNNVKIKITNIFLIIYKFLHFI